MGYSEKILNSSPVAPLRAFTFAISFSKSIPTLKGATIVVATATLSKKLLLNSFLKLSISLEIFKLTLIPFKFLFNLLIVLFSLIAALLLSLNLLARFTLFSLSSSIFSFSFWVFLIALPNALTPLKAAPIVIATAKFFKIRPFLV